MTVGRAVAAGIAGVICAGVWTAPASAHPHVFVDATVTPLFDAAHRLSAVHEKWTFDDAFTEGIGPDLDVNKNGLLEDSEIQNATADGELWFVPYSYFTRITVGGQPVNGLSAGDFRVAIPGARMVFEFTLTLAAPAAVTAGAGIDVFDPEFYVDVEFADPGIDAGHAPPGCTATKRQQANLDPVAVLLIRKLGLPADPAVLNDPAAGYPVRVAIDCT